MRSANEASEVIETWVQSKGQRAPLIATPGLVARALAHFVAAAVTRRSMRECGCHGMQGTVLLLTSDRSVLAAVDVWRAEGLIVHHCHGPAQALAQFEQIAPDVVVALLSGHESPSLLPELRSLADYATSIIVASAPEQREVARKAGADAFLLKSAPGSDLLYEIHRALILRRSGRRLPWNW